MGQHNLVTYSPDYANDCVYVWIFLNKKLRLDVVYLYNYCIIAVQ